MSKQTLKRALGEKLPEILNYLEKNGNTINVLPEDIQNKITEIKNDKEKILRYAKCYYKKNKDKIIKRCIKYAKEHKEKSKVSYCKYYEKNKEKIKERNKQYYKKNKEKINMAKKQYRIRKKLEKQNAIKNTQPQANEKQEKQ